MKSIDCRYGRLNMLAVVVLCLMSCCCYCIGESMTIRTLLCDTRNCCSSPSSNTDGNCSCKTYVSPSDSCYNPKQLFDSDPQWGTSDIFDTCFGNQGTYYINRTFFASTDGTCSGSPTGNFSKLPTGGLCVGPFGAPRPWGSFSCSHSIELS